MMTCGSDKAPYAVAGDTYLMSAYGGEETWFRKARAHTKAGR